MSDSKITRLTRAEEQVMKIIWDLKEANVKKIVNSFELPRPAYTTVATVLKVLEKKEFVSNEKKGNILYYRAVVSKNEYTKFQLSNLLVNYFNGSFPKMATFFAKENDISINELEEIINEAREELDKEA
ncbi:MAG: BlaI/MecI/CopY family transcriptional regulator [Marinilabiliaceae bacterium]|jgi:predicted transcriptional regulator|nr:BlaI/MecI/CopY family transcriptional regulator [Marinilabiliaceae bacterium]